MDILYKTAFQDAPYGVLLIDTNGIPLAFNEAAHLQLGYTAAEFSRLRISDISPHQTPEEIQASMRRALMQGRAEFEVRHRTKDGEMKDVLVTMKCAQIAGKAVFQTIWQDVTERKRSEEELETYREQLETMVRQRTAELSSARELLEQDNIRRKQIEEENQELIAKLQGALSEIKVLRGLMRVCAWCRKIQDDRGQWQRLEDYIEARSEARFTHGICPECMKFVETGQQKDSALD